MGERLLKGEAFRQSQNDYDWLGPGVYFWEANPLRAYDFATEMRKRKDPNIRKPFVVGAVVDLALCLDLTTKVSIDWVRDAHESLVATFSKRGLDLPTNSPDLLKRNLDCAVIRRLHEILESTNSPAIDTVKGIFIEGSEIYPTSGFHEKTHVQIAVRNLECIKAVFRVKEYD